MVCTRCEIDALTSRAAHRWQSFLRPTELEGVHTLALRCAREGATAIEPQKEIACITLTSLRCASEWKCPVCCYQHEQTSISPIWMGALFIILLFVADPDKPANRQTALHMLIGEIEDMDVYV